MAVKEEEVRQLTSVLESDPDSWMSEKVSLVNQVAELKLSGTSLEEGLKHEQLEHQASRIRVEELEIELDRLEREIAALKTAASGRKHVSWGSNTIVRIQEPAMISPRPLSINVGKSHSRFDGSLPDASQHAFGLSVRVPHHRSKSIPPSLHF